MSSVAFSKCGAFRIGMGVKQKCSPKVKPHQRALATIAWQLGLIVFQLIGQSAALSPEAFGAMRQPYITQLCARPRRMGEGAELDQPRVGVISS